MHNPNSENHVPEHLPAPTPAMCLCAACPVHGLVEDVEAPLTWRSAAAAAAVLAFMVGVIVVTL